MTPNSDVVYLLRDSSAGALKIGHSATLSKRLSTLQTGSARKHTLLYVAEGGRRLEQGLHFTFRELRIRGEWYKDSNAITEWFSLNAIEVGQVCGVSSCDDETHRVHCSESGRLVSLCERHHRSLRQPSYREVLSGKAVFAKRTSM